MAIQKNSAAEEQWWTLPQKQRQGENTQNVLSVCQGPKYRVVQLVTDPSSQDVYAVSDLSEILMAWNSKLGWSFFSKDFLHISWLPKISKNGSRLPRTAFDSRDWVRIISRSWWNQMILNSWSSSFQCFSSSSELPFFFVSGCWSCKTLEPCCALWSTVEHLKSVAFSPSFQIRILSEPATSFLPPTRKFWDLANHGTADLLKHSWNGLHY